jgi:hypothetical protein
VSPDLEANQNSETFCIVLYCKRWTIGAVRKHRLNPVYQYNDRLTQLFTKYKYMYLALATMFRPLSGSSSGLYNELRKCSTCLGTLSTTLSSLLFRPDDDPDKGRNIVAIAKYVYTW